MRPLKFRLVNSYITIALKLMGRLFLLWKELVILYDILYDGVGSKKYDCFKSFDENLMIVKI